MIDNQWPSPYLIPHKYKNNINEKLNRQKINYIEKFFIDKFGYDAILLPSGRAAIGLIIRFEEINRSQKVYISKWSSHCLFYTIGAFSNVTVDFVGRPDMILINHKWGYERKLKKKYPNSVLLEDSVDSIHLTREAFFPNQAKYEIVSLPKILGCYSGCILFSKNKKLSNYARNLQYSQPNLAQSQSYLKSIKPEQWKNFSTPYYYEAWNTSQDANALDNIILSLEGYNRNRDTILLRHDQVKQHLGISDSVRKRIGPIIPLPQKKYKLLKDDSLIIRHFSFSPFIESPDYEKVFVLPVHFGISQSVFDTLLLSLAER